MNDQNEVKLQSARWATQTVQCIVVSFEILTIQAVKFVEFSRYMSLFKIYEYKDECDIKTSRLFLVTYQHHDVQKQSRLIP